MAVEDLLAAVAAPVLAVVRVSTARVDGESRGGDEHMPRLEPSFVSGTKGGLDEGGGALLLLLQHHLVQLPPRCASRRGYPPPCTLPPCS
uniref:Uncharacterized protein n=1 Tax=Oryza glaberrima TaxID=4538 RepID=I1QBG4_ORYGL